MWSKSLNVYLILALQLSLLCDATSSTSSTSSTDSERTRDALSTLQQAHGGRDDGLHALPDGFNIGNQLPHSVEFHGKTEMPQIMEGVPLRQDPLDQLQAPSSSRAVVGTSSPPIHDWWRQYRARYKQPLPKLFGWKFTAPNPNQKEALQYYGYGDRVEKLDLLRNKVLEHLRPWLSQIEVQRLQQKFHPWKSVSYEAARSRARDYEGLIEAEKLYILEVERILERVAGRRTDMF